MGVEREQFIIYGIKDKYETFVPKKYIEEEDEKPEKYRHVVDAVVDFKPYRYDIFDWRHFVPVYIGDGMSGEYSVFGILIGAYGQDRWGEARDVDCALSLEDISLLDDKFVELCEKNNVPVSEYEVGLFILTHYT